MRRTHWRRAPDRRAEARELAAAHQLHPVVAHVLLNRGVGADELVEFLRPSRASLHDPKLLPDLERAAERLALAVREKQKVCIYGDYDADGTTAGALVSRFLGQRDVPYLYYVPDRFEEGYGLNAGAIIKVLTQHRPALLITVDCGISAAAEIDTAVALGADVIVTDHHQVPERLPSAPSVDPHRPDSVYPFKELCGAAVAYKLCCATAALLGENPRTTEADLLELVVIGTVADVMPLLGENRFFVYHGLKRLARTDNLGLRALLQTAGLGKDGTLSSRDIGFGIGPRLNAAGRLDTARDSYELLVTDDNARAFEIAEQLEGLNRERRELEGRLSEIALDQVHALGLSDKFGLVVAGEGWHEGVLGLVAGRLCQRFHRPALAISVNGEDAKGSGRSTDAFDLHAGLSECSALLTRFGGHKRAAGFSLKSADLDELRELFPTVCQARLTDDDLVQTIDLDCALKAGALTLDLARSLALLAPHGEANPEPCFEIAGLRIADARATRDGVHAQLTFSGGADRIKGFWPRGGNYVDRLAPGAAVTVAGNLGIDTWNGDQRLQVTVVDLRPD